ncbi:hypothetical protein F511_41120 [Dorcoceras hygrometricum]|uniref:Uncharacterized protein n=1 Tax=Dorcoceras hygrometricum TaxID=472368 RepID=A0A2Z7B5U1_9LAMI|nr:hypothetical protein F511_41120 [Dorcoceras hygrometricum]
MASALINNASQIYFDSDFGMDNEGMVKIFKAIESSRLKGFLGCYSPIYEAVLVEFFQNASVRDDKVCNPDADIYSTSPSTFADSLVHFTTDDIPLGVEIADDQILMPTTAIPATNFTESFAHLRASVTHLSIKQLRTKGSIGDLKNQLLSKIDNLEKYLVEAHAQQDHVLRGFLKNVRQEVQIQKTALSLEMIESKREVRAQYVILTTDLADIRKEVQDQKAAMLAFREDSQEHYSTLRENLAEIIAYINRGRDDKRGKVVAAEVRSRLLTTRADLVVVV